MNTLKNIVRLLAGSPDGLQAVLNHSQRLEALNRVLSGCIPAPLNQHCQVANLRDNILVLHADSSAWALKLRYGSRTLLQQLRQRGMPRLDTIEVKVRPPNPTLHRPDKIRPVQMSAKTAQLLDSIASGINDSHLKSALQRLAQHGKEVKMR